MTGDQDYTCNIPPIPPYSAWQPVQTPTLRQMYAMAAIPAVVGASCPNGVNLADYPSANDWQTEARAAFAIADAMLDHEAKEKQA